MVGGENPFRVNPNCTQYKGNLACTLKAVQRDRLICKPDEEGSQMVCREQLAKNKADERLVCDIRSDGDWDCVKRRETKNGRYTVDGDNYVTDDGRGRRFASQRTGICNTPMSLGKAVSRSRFLDGDEMQCVIDGLLDVGIDLPKEEFFLNSNSGIKGSFCINVEDVDRNDDILEYFDVIEECMDKGREGDEERVEAFRKFIYKKTHLDEDSWVWKYVVAPVGGLLGIFGVFIWPGPRIGRWIDRKIDNWKDPPPPAPGGQPEEQPRTNPLTPMQPVTPPEFHGVDFSSPEYDFLRWDPGVDVQPITEEPVVFEIREPITGSWTPDSEFGVETVIGAAAALASRAVPVLDAATKGAAAVYEGISAGASAAGEGIVTGASFLGTLGTSLTSVIVVPMCILDPMDDCSGNGGVPEA